MLLIILLLLFRICFSLKVYHSQLPIESKSGLSGLKYLKEQQNSIIFSNSFTICSRFNFKKLGNTARLFEIQPSNNSEANFLWLSISYPWTWFGFGNSDKKLNGKGFYSSWLLQDPITKDFNIWYTNKWHHVCIAYDSEKSHITFIKVLCSNMNL